MKAFLGDLTAMADGEFTKWTGTTGEMRFSTRFALVAAITPLALREHHRYMHQMGSRFLCFRGEDPSDAEYRAGLARAWEPRDRKAVLEDLRRLVHEHVEAVTAAPVEPAFETPEQQDTLSRLALLLARGRTVIKYGKQLVADEEGEGASYTYAQEVVQVERPWRALQQLRTLARALARIHGRTALTAARHRACPAGRAFLPPLGLGRGPGPLPHAAVRPHPGDLRRRHRQE